MEPLKHKGRPHPVRTDRITAHRAQIKGLSLKNKRPFLRMLQKIQASQKRRLTRAGRPEDHRHVSFFHRQTDVLKHRHVAKALFQMFDRKHPLRFPFHIGVEFLFTRALQKSKYR